MFAHFVTGSKYFGNSSDAQNTTSFEIHNLSEQKTTEGLALIQFDVSEIFGSFIEKHGNFVCVIDGIAYHLNMTPSVSKTNADGALSVWFSVNEESINREKRSDAILSYKTIYFRDRLKNSEDATVSMWLGILSIFLFSPLSFFAYYYATKAYSLLDSDVTMKGKSRADVGYVCAMINFVLYAIIIMGIIVLFFAVLANSRR